MQILKFKKTGNAFLCALPLLCISHAVLAEWLGNTEVVIRHDSNVNNAQSGKDIAGDSALGADISATGFFPLEAGGSLSLSGALQGEAFDTHTGLNNASLGATLALRKKWGLGSYAPWGGASLSSAHLNFTNNTRNGWRNQVAIRGGKRILERWDVRAEYMVERRTADALPPIRPGISGDVFSQDSRALTLNAEYIWSDSLFLAFGFLLRHGDVVATTRKSQKIFSASNAIAADPVFGPNFYAYRITGTSYGLNAGMNIAVTSRNLLHASLARQVTHGEGGNNYAKNVAILSWSYNF